MDHPDDVGVFHAEALSHPVFLPGSKGMDNIILSKYLSHRLSLPSPLGNAGLGPGNIPLGNIFPPRKIYNVQFSLGKFRIFLHHNLSF